MGWDSCTPMWLSTWVPLIASGSALAVIGLIWLIKYLIDHGF